jgi:nicotinamidase-related amidase
MTHAHQSTRRAAGLAAALAITLGWAAAAPAQTIVDEWAKAQPPAAPQLKPAAVDAKTTALLVIDFVKQSCNNERRPRCLASIPKVKDLIASAKAKGVTVIYTLYPGAKPEDFVPELAPPSGTSFVVSNANKFVGTDLEKTLKDKGMTTLILAGTAAHAAILFTAGDAAQRGFQVVMPVDGLSAETLYLEQATVAILASASTISNRVTLTRTDMISYR